MGDGQSAPLASIRVLDFGWVLAGAIPGMVLADLGAEVIKVESRRRPDYMRLGRPVRGDTPDPEQNPMFHNVNRNKLSVTLDPTQPAATELLHHLVALSDVVVENFSPGVMERLTLGYETLRRARPDLIMVSLSAAGREGPLRDLRAYAPSINALSGLDSLIGYAGDRPLGLKHIYSDLCAALHAVFAILAALYHRRRTGKGQYIDISMLRATAVTLGTGILEYLMNGRVLGPRGNYDPTLAPYNSYPCAGEDAWLSIAVGTEEEWQELCRAMGDPPWTREERFASRYGRLKHREELDRHIAQWTRQHDARDLTERLQAHGVAAMPVMNAMARLFDPHFRDRGLYAEVEHPALGAEPIFNLMWHLSRTPPHIRRHAPLMGEHNPYVCGELLGLSQAERDSLAEAQVIY